MAHLRRPDGEQVVVQGVHLQTVGRCLAIAEQGAVQVGPRVQVVVGDEIT